MSGFETSTFLRSVVPDERKSWGNDDDVGNTIDRREENLTYDL